MPVKVANIVKVYQYIKVIESKLCLLCIHCYINVVVQTFYILSTLGLLGHLLRCIFTPFSPLSVLQSHHSHSILTLSTSGTSCTLAFLQGITGQAILTTQWPPLGENSVAHGEGHIAPLPVRDQDLVFGWQHRGGRRGVVTAHVNLQ